MQTACRATLPADRPALEKGWMARPMWDVVAFRIRGWTVVDDARPTADPLYQACSPRCYTPSSTARHSTNLKLTAPQGSAHLFLAAGCKLSRGAVISPRYRCQVIGGGNPMPGTTTPGRGPASRRNSTAQAITTFCSPATQQYPLLGGTLNMAVLKGAHHTKRPRRQGPRPLRRSAKFRRHKKDAGAIPGAPIRCFTGSSPLPEGSPCGQWQASAVRQASGAFLGTVRASNLQPAPQAPLPHTTGRSLVKNASSLNFKRAWPDRPNLRTAMVPSQRSLFSSCRDDPRTAASASSHVRQRHDASWITNSGKI